MNIENTLSAARLARYLPAANGDRHLALRLYVWNARLCESLYLPFQFAEVSARNAICIPVRKRFGQQWYADHRFENILQAHLKEELSFTLARETSKRRALLNENHIIASLSFGFWLALMTTAYDKQLWANGIRHSFPGATRVEGRHEIYVRLDALRRFRNDIEHHVAIFDRQPQRELQNAFHVTQLVCADTHWLSKELGQLNRVINDRPRI